MEIKCITHSYFETQLSFVRPELYTAKLHIALFLYTRVAIGIAIATLFVLKRVLIKTHCYSVTMMITNFVQAALNKVFNGELADIKFAGFEEIQVNMFAFFENMKTCKNVYINFL